MATKNIYRGQFTNVETTLSNEDNGQLITIDIHDQESGEAEYSTIIPLEMGDSPLEIEVIDNDEDKFTPKRSKRAVIQIHSSDAIGNETFADGGDNRFKVFIYSPTEMLLISWLSIADVSEDFLPDPNILVLTATDGLGFLADEALTDLDGNNPQNQNRIIDYLIWSLAKTGLSLGFAVAFNIREADHIPINVDSEDFGHFFKNIWLDAKTLEAEIGVSEDCLTVLEKIFGEQCFIEQRNGLWWIMRIDEMEIGADVYVYRWDAEGTFISMTQTTLEKSIGAASPMQWMNDNAQVLNERINKQVKHTYRYETFAEPICNMDFDRGTGPEITGADSETVDYVPECMDLFRNDGLDVDVAPIAGSVGIIRKTFEYGYEKDRYIILKTAGGFPHYLKLSPIEVEEGARVRVEISHRFNTDESAVSAQIAALKLYGDDGSIWDWEYNTTTDPATNQWVLSSAANWTNPWTDNVSGMDNREWKSMGTTSNDIPVSGQLIIRLYNQLAPPVEQWYNNLNVEYIPKVNGSFQKYTGQTHTTTQPTNPERYKSIRDVEVFISDSPSRQYKGALLKKGTGSNLISAQTSVGDLGQFELEGDQRSIFRAGMRLEINGSFSINPALIEAKILSVSYASIGDVTTIYTDADTQTEVGIDASFFLVKFVLTEGFYRANLQPSGLGSADPGVPYGEIQNGDVWNQYNRTMRKFDGSIDRLQTASVVPDLIDKYFLTDTNANTNNKAFQLLHYKQNFLLCEWEGFLHEVHDSTKTKEYDSHEFKYITG